jgi:hypothetical protein
MGDLRGELLIKKCLYVLGIHRFAIIKQPLRPQVFYDYAHQHASACTRINFTTPWLVPASSGGNPRRMMPQRRSDFPNLARAAARTSSTTPRILICIERIEQHDAERAEVLI